MALSGVIRCEMEKVREGVQMERVERVGDSCPRPLLRGESSRAPQGKVYPPPLHSHEEVVRDSMLFMDSLQKFHYSMGTKFMNPVIGRKELDLHLLYVEVTRRGGLENVMGTRKWKEVIAAFDFPATITSASYVLRKYYLSLLHHYEQVYFFRTQGPPVPPADSLQTKTPFGRLGNRLMGFGSTMQQPWMFGKRSLPEPPKEININGINNFTVSGSIDGKFEHGYLVTVKIGSDTLRGVLYHVDQQTALAIPVAPPAGGAFSLAPTVAVAPPAGVFPSATPVPVAPPFGVFPSAIPVTVAPPPARVFPSGTPVAFAPPPARVFPSGTPVAVAPPPPARVFPSETPVAVAPPPPARVFPSGTPVAVAPPPPARVFPSETPVAVAPPPARVFPSGTPVAVAPPTGRVFPSGTPVAVAPPPARVFPSATPVAGAVFPSVAPTAVNPLTTAPQPQIAGNGSGVLPRQGRPRRARRYRAPGHPKPNRSAYNFFFAEKHAKLKISLPNKEREFSKVIGDSWNKLTEAERMVYKEQALKDKERYKRELIDYRRRNEVSAAKGLQKLRNMP